MGNLVEPTERRHMDVPTGQNSHGWRDAWDGVVYGALAMLCEK